MDRGTFYVERALKLLYRPSTEKRTREAGAADQRDVAELALPLPVRREVSKMLQQRNELMPGPLASAMGWCTAWL